MKYICMYLFVPWKPMQDVTSQGLKMIIWYSDISISMTALSIGDYILAFQTQTHCYNAVN